MRNKHQLTNEGCRNQAERALRDGNYLLAVRWYNTAAARTMGHKKTARYEAIAQGIRDEHNITAIPPDEFYADDSEAIPTEYRTTNTGQLVVSRNCLGQMLVYHRNPTSHMVTWTGADGKTQWSYGNLPHDGLDWDALTPCDPPA